MKKVLVSSVLAFAAACGGSKPAPTPARDNAQPEWLSSKAGAAFGETGKWLQGVGSSSASDPKDRRKAADAAAREKLEQSLDALVVQLVKLSESKQDELADTMGAIAKRTLASAQVMDHYVAGDGTEQAVAVLDLDTFRSAVRKVDGDGKLKAEMASNAGRAFDAMAKR